MLDEIEHEIMHAQVHKQVYCALRDEIVARRPGTDATFLNSYSYLYARGQIMMIRRLADNSRDKPQSLWWLIERTRNNPNLASRQALTDLVREQHPDDPFFANDANRVFTEHFGDGELPSDEALESMQRQLLSQLEAVIEFADRHVAHRDPRGARQSVTYGEIHAAIDHVAAVANRLNMLLRNRAVMFEDVIFQGDWQAVFRPTLFPIDPMVYAFPDEEGYT